MVIQNDPICVSLAFFSYAENFSSFSHRWQSRIQGSIKLQIKLWLLDFFVFDYFILFESRKKKDLFKRFTQLNIWSFDISMR